MPFLSIITRHLPQRHNFFKRCKASVENQTDKDFEQIVIIDSEGLGIPHANRRFFANKHLIKGDYVFILDDDDFLMTDDFISDMKQIAKDHSPDIIFVKTLINSIPYPTERVWKKDKMVPHHIGSSCSVITNKLWQENVEYFKTSDTPGDFNFINAAFSNDLTVYWQDKFYSVALLNWGRGIDYIPFKD